MAFLRKDGVNSMSKKNHTKLESPLLAAGIMVKNEEKFIKTTLDSLIGHISVVFIYDTGSDDNTVSVCEDWGASTGIDMNIMEGEFVDFSSSRNQLLMFVDNYPSIEFLLLLDCGDQLRGGKQLTEWCKTASPAEDAWLLQQEWWSGTSTRYWNIRLIRPRCGWHYKEPVHEYLTRKNALPPRKLSDKIVLYQDRTVGDDKSMKRFHRDEEILLKQFKLNPTNPRTLFYLAQTMECLGKYIDSIMIYSRRFHVVSVGFGEERFQSALRIGDIYRKKLNKPERSVAWYLKALSISERVEPYLGIVEVWRRGDNPSWNPAWLFVKRACELPYPKEASLFVDPVAYSYFRWHLAGIVAYYAGDYVSGLRAVDKAIEARNQKQDYENREFYIRKMSEKPRHVDATSVGRTLNSPDADGVALLRERLRSKVNASKYS